MKYLEMFKISEDCAQNAECFISATITGALTGALIGMIIVLIGVASLVLFD